MNLPKQERLPNDAASVHAALAYHLEKGASVALWQFPHSKKKNLIAADWSTHISIDTPMEQLVTGFVLVPFDPKADCFFIAADKSYVFDNDAPSKETAWSPSAPTPFHTLPIPDCNYPERESHYLKLVRKSVRHIAEGDFQKVVACRRKTIHLPSKKILNPLSLFNQLCLQYPHALVSLISTPETGTWVGASPELLASLDADGQLKTTALAGTQATPQNNDLTAVSWAQKDIEEQALVSRYITDCLKRVEVKEFRKNGPKTWQAGNLIHLKTNFTVDTKLTKSPQLLSKLLALLHPTPAICGLPKKAVMDFLKDNESFNRQFYSGYIGPVNYLNESHLYVNLRCMQWNNESAFLYAGAGIVGNSIPEKEWTETEMKMNTLLHIIKNREGVLF